MSRRPDPEYSQRWQHLPYFGTRTQVYHGQARYTRGFLRREDLTKNKKNRIVSLLASKQACLSSHLGPFLDLVRLSKNSRFRGRNREQCDPETTLETLYNK